MDDSNEAVENNEESILASKNIHFILVCLVCLGFILAIYIFYPALEAVSRKHSVPQVAQDNTLATPNNNTKQKQDKDQGSFVLLSIIIPAYNEEDRLVTMLEAADRYLSTEDCPALKVLEKALLESKNDIQDVSKSKVEWILVNDGSKDRTSQVYETYVANRRIDTQDKKQPSRSMVWRLCSLAQNSGKGGAVQAGMLRAKGYFSLMVDADGATDFGPGLEAVASSAHTHELVFGSRAVGLHQTEQNSSSTTNQRNSDSSMPQRSWFRKLLQAAFHAFVVLVVGYRNVHDTQCGFKLFTSPSTRQVLFQGLHLHRWAFDIELFVRARNSQLRVKEVPVPWQEIDGSKLNTNTWNLLRVAIGMLRDMICVRVCYTFGIWSVKSVMEEQKKDR